MTYEYFSGREKKPLAKASTSSPETASLFDEEVVDSQEFTGHQFHQCTFSTLGAKKVKFHQVRFQNCVFLDCYLNQSEFRGCTFIGCKFIRCSFTMAIFFETTMQYCRFYDCGLAFEQAKDLCTSNASDAYRFLRNLYEENRKMGHWESANKLLMLSIKEQEKHWRNIFTSANPHYQRNYTGAQRRTYRWRYYYSRAGDLVWGHGLSPWRALRALLASVLLYSLLLYFFSPLAWKAPQFLDAAWGSFSAAVVSMMPFAGLAATESARPVLAETPMLIELFGALLGLAFFGLFVSMLFERVRRN